MRVRTTHGSTVPRSPALSVLSPNMDIRSQWRKPGVSLSQWKHKLIRRQAFQRALVGEIDARKARIWSRAHIASSRLVSRELVNIFHFGILPGIDRNQNFMLPSNV